MARIYCDDCDKNVHCYPENNGGGQLEYVCPECLVILRTENDPAYPEGDVSDTFHGW